MHPIKCKAGILRTAAKYALNSEYAPISDMRLITCQYSVFPLTLSFSSLFLQLSYFPIPQKSKPIWKIT